MPTYSQRNAFTLIEMLVVMAVIAILAGLVLSINSYAQRKSATVKTEGEIKTLELAVENYKGDNGVYPSTKDTEELDPRRNGAVSSKAYEKASVDLYKALSGDEDADGNLTEKEKHSKNYAADFFTPARMSIEKSSKRVKYLQDPFGNCYGYSTAGAKAEQEFREDLAKNPKARRATDPSKVKGFNSTFDLWSTGGTTSKRKAGDPVPEEEQMRWIKNW